MAELDASGERPAAPAKDSDGADWRWKALDAFIRFVLLPIAIPTLGGLAVYQWTENGSLRDKIQSIESRVLVVEATRYTSADRASERKQEAEAIAAQRREEGAERAQMLAAISGMQISLTRLEAEAKYSAERRARDAQDQAALREAIKELRAEIRAGKH